MPRARDAVILSVLALLSIGVIMVSSAGMSVGDETPVTFQSIVLSRPSLYLVLALAAMAAASWLPVHRIAQWAQGSKAVWALIPVMLLALAIVYVPGIGHAVKGSNRWIKIPIPGVGLTMQPSEVAKWGMIVLVSWFAVRNADRLPQFRRGLLPALGLVGFIAAVVIKEDLGTGVLIMAMSAIVLIAAGARFWHFAAMAPIAGAGLALAILIEPYRVRRLTSFIDPYQDPQGIGYHPINSMVAIANGQGYGRGLGFGLQKFGYLPEDKTDFLFSVICEETGIIGATVVVSLYVLLLVSGWKIVSRQTQPLLKLVGLGILSTVGLQALINLLVVTGLAPTKGIALPLLSSGGTGWILTAASLGILVAMDRVRTPRTHQMALPVPHAEPKPLAIPLPFPAPPLIAEPQAA